MPQQTGGKIMYEHEPTKNLMQMLLGLRADRFTETGRCKCCGKEWRYSAPTEGELRKGIADMGYMCAYCESVGDEERERIRKWAEDETASQGKGLFYWLFGI
jgi:hypothetical protein